MISLLQQQALAAQVTQLGGDPATIGRAVSDATPDVTELDPPERGTADFQARYAVLLFADMVLLVAIMFGGQAITTGVVEDVVEEKSSRIVEILLACVRPASLLAGKILGIGAAIILSWGLVVVAATATAHAMDVLAEHRSGPQHRCGRDPGVDADRLRPRLGPVRRRRRPGQPSGGCQWGHLPVYSI